MAKKKRDAFMKRTYSIYYHQAERADGTKLDYTIFQLRELVQSHLDKACPHCTTKLTAKNFGVDHAIPIIRGGTHTFDNLRVMCMSCNTIKGPMTTIEFMKLLQCIKNLPIDIEANIKARLKAGSRTAQFKPSVECTHGH